MNETLKGSISKLKEEELTKEIVIPLIEKLHPGKIEYTHSSIESGRDIISYGKDTLDRQHIICIQVKAIRISYGAMSFMSLINVGKLAKTEGVTNVDGNKIIPHEVWLISSKPFPANERKQVADTIKELSQNGIKIIALDELINIIMAHMPDVAARFAKHTDVSVTNIISAFSKHNESRAFGLPIDKLLEDFYIPVTLAPQASYSTIALNNAFEIESKYEFSVEVSLLDYINSTKSNTQFSKIFKIIKEDLKRRYCFLKIDENKFDEITNRIFLKESFTRVVFHDFLRSYSEYEKQVKNKKKIKDDFFYSFQYSITVNIELNPKYKFFKYIASTKKSIKACPSTLNEKFQNFIEAYSKIIFLNKYTFQLLKEFDLTLKDDVNNDLDLIRINVPNPDLLLKLSDFILIDGPPGGGKTTFLKILTVSLLDKGIKVLYVPCSLITPDYLNKSLEKIVKDWSLEKLGKKWKLNECILILDGLDEATFDITEKVLLESHKFKKIILSTRYAFKTALREKAFNIGVALFSAEDRNLFFERWYMNDRIYLNKIKSLIKRYDDIDYHTRLPLIATLTATLIQNDYEPTTRIEIYNFRLDLLLSKWDRYRGIARLKIDNPSAKKKFLMTLAYSVHNDVNRRKNFSIDDIKSAYEISLGDWGYKHDYNELLIDLTVGSGLILNIREGVYTLGHLSFQEHLAGEYLFHNKVTYSIIKGLLNLDWWREPLLFYAAASGNITDLVNYVSKDEDFFLFANQLYEMSYYAPYTAPGAIQIIEEAIDLIEEEELTNEM